MLRARLLSSTVIVITSAPPPQRMSGKRAVTKIGPPKPPNIDQSWQFCQSYLKLYWAGVHAHNVSEQWAEYLERDTNLMTLVEDGDGALLKTDILVPVEISMAAA